jgi:hypothetical protein
MVFTTALPQPLQPPPGGLSPGLYPVVGNGYVAQEAGPLRQWFANTLNPFSWRDAGNIHVAGLYTGYNFSVNPSHRVAVPSLFDVHLIPQSGGSYVQVGSAVDFAVAAYYNRTVVAGSPTCPSGAQIELRMYAHRALRHVLVLDLTATAADGSGAPLPAPCSVPVAWNRSIATPDAVLAVSPPQAGGYVTWVGTNVEPEEPGLPLTAFAIAWDAWAAVLPPSPTPAWLNFTPSAPVLSVRAAIFTNITGDDGAADPTAAAVSAWQSLAGVSPSALFQQHADAWGLLWQSGVEIEGNATMAAAVNVSLYDILSSLRADWPWDTSPGGLATNGYASHAFWDSSTWMMPTIIALAPDIARAMVQYRLDRLPAAVQRAVAAGWDGAAWPWESAVTGLDTAVWRDADEYEQHINADLPLAWRRLWLATGDVGLLRTMWPALNATCAFWACRFRRVDSTGVAPPPGYGPACSPKDGVGNWTLHGVICPDESSGVVNDSAYTNAAGAAALAWCAEAAAVLGEFTPPLWAAIAAAPYLPLMDTPMGLVHQEYTGYGGGIINQADVALLQYPLGLTCTDGDAQCQRDLDFWSARTSVTGPFTGDSSYSAAYLALGDRAAADAQVALIWQHMDTRFFVFEETADGSHTQHFITGSGGLLQTFVFAYPGLRQDRLGVWSFTHKQPVLPPAGVTGVKLRGMHLFNSTFDLGYNATHACAVTQVRGCDLQMRLPGGGAPVPLPLAPAPPLCVPVGPLEVGVVGLV